ncbi:FAD-dependent oxidoreductase [Bacillus sp. ISL-35]|uniref:FAD-dependent oxidoreductase n=1 Tax=Bacillus sp. ISL-35 TaxID=2819122 RepID=UPI001BEB0E48|nr:FAD-dependent oxidoreductase [Bacillus sp. ISL-35]MBT2677921.1 FAD-dependent oxidoreductase [Bacillus sp. ISL-35]MBT2705496.1 FAD-dependent oxidoreductase [Chryseobacterium sp. ISL-80]
MFDVLVVGGGISGGSAAIYTAQGGLKTAVIDSGKSQIKQVSKVFNYPGIKEVSGPELLENIKDQAVAAGSEWFDGTVQVVEKKESVYEVSMADGRKLETKYLVIATNLQTSILESLGFEMAVNEKVPSGKIKKVLGIDTDGKTHLPNLFITSLLAGLPSQSVIASGHGASVGISIVSAETGKSYMWHDK